jgi:hypothetical protein
LQGFLSTDFSPDLWVSGEQLFIDNNDLLTVRMAKKKEEVGVKLVQQRSMKCVPDDAASVGASIGRQDMASELPDRAWPILCETAFKMDRGQWS